MMTAVVHYEIFAKSPDYEMSPYMMGYSAGATLRSVTRAKEAKRFRPPSFMCMVGGTFRQPLPFDDAAARGGIDEAATCYIVEYVGDRQDSLWYLDAALKLVGDIAKQCKGIVVDRTADAFVSKQVLKSWGKGLAARDTVSLREAVKGEYVTLASEGMSKYGQADFVLERFPVELVEMGRRLLYDNLCSYSMGRAVLAGQTFGGGAVRMIFVADRRGRLEIRDVHSERKAALAGIGALVAGLRPIWEAQAATEAAIPKQKTAAKKKAAPKQKIATTKTATKRKVTATKAAPKRKRRSVTAPR